MTNLGMHSTRILRLEEGIAFLDDMVYRHSPAVISLHGNEELNRTLANELSSRLEHRSKHGIFTSDKNPNTAQADFYLISSEERPCIAAQNIEKHFSKQPNAKLLVVERKLLEETLLKEKYDLSHGAYCAVVVVDAEGRI
ncbi:hypothetical protein J4219_07870 [Candidatus Woesearchaeota archaeon]|nr:hypothetical protein [Candidatus Woesearchaeota archaeon]